MASIYLENVGYFRYLPKGRNSPHRKLRPRFVVSEVSFQVSDGDRVALIGRNGAGKTTVLRLLAGFLTPDVGTIEVIGRTGAVLENGTGVDRDLTGRQVAHTRGVCSGLTNRGIGGWLETVENTCELGDAFDHPVSTYSQGMIARLMFSMNTASSPEVLLVDEGFGAADADFQLNVMRRMSEMLSTVKVAVFASHNLEFLSRTCNRAVWLERGRVQMIGDVNEVIGRYLDRQ